MEPSITADALLLMSPFLIFFLLIPLMALLLGDSAGITAVKSGIKKLFRLSS